MLSRVYAGLLTAIVGSAIGCGQSPVAPSPTPAAQSAAATTVYAMPGASNTPYGMKGTDVPFSGTVTGELMLVPGSAKCPQGPYALGSIKASGNVLHMGNTDLRTEQCVNVATGVIDGKVIVLTAANGDELHGTFSGQSEAPGNVGDQFHVAATFVFEGGTGRFEHATGTAAMKAVLTHAASLPYPGRWEWTGTLRY